MKNMVKQIINKKRAIETTGLNVNGVRWDKSFPSSDPQSAVYAMGLRPIVNEEGALIGVYEEEADIFFEDRSGHILNDELLARLISMPNVIVSSHQAFLTQDALANIADTTLDNIRTFLAEGTSVNELCYKCGKLQECGGKKSGKCF